MSLCMCVCVCVCVFLCIFILCNIRVCVAVAISQWLSRVQLFDPMDYRMPGFPVLLDLPEFAQIHAH